MWKPVLVLSVFSATLLPVRGQEAEIKALAEEAYVFGYPLVTMEYTRRVMTNVAVPTGNHAPMGQFAHIRAYPTADFKDVTAPNADTLYSVAWLDLNHDAYAFIIPDAKDRFFLMPMLDGYTDVFTDPGKRTTGTKMQMYCITGPNFKGTVPKELVELKCLTSIVWILGRTYCTGTPEDYKAVHAFQDGLTLVPLASYGKPYSPAPSLVDPKLDSKTAVREQVHALSAAVYFQLLAKLMKDNPPRKQDSEMLAKMKRIGLEPGKDFDEKKLGEALNGVPKTAQEKIMKNLSSIGSLVNGWQVSTKLGLYGTRYLDRATTTAIGLGANRPQDAIYPMSETDAAGKPYHGTNKYSITFPKGELPPVNAFWSITMYNDQYFFAANALDKYTVSPRNDLKQNSDGSITIYIQHESPGADKQANWLPAPKDGFKLCMRLYWPKENAPSILDGTWKPPAAAMAK